MRVSPWVAAPIAAAALVAAGSVAFAAGTTTTATSPLSAFWNAMSAKVGVPAATLESAAKAVMQQERPAGFRMPRLAKARDGTFAVRRPLLATAASYLGVTQAALVTDLRSGKSMAEIATAAGKSVSGLEGALSTKATQAIDQAVQHVWTPRSQAGSRAPSGATGG